MRSTIPWEVSSPSRGARGRSGRRPSIWNTALAPRAPTTGSKKRSVALSKELPKRFMERFGALRCQDLLKNKNETDPVKTPAAHALGITAHCSIMIVTAVEIVEEMLRERG